MRSRWPRWVYTEGEEPDYRFSFANERTYLAWIRTAIALIAAGVAVDVVDLGLRPGFQHWLAIGLVSLGLLCALAALARWAMAERAMRRGEPLPTFFFGVVLTFALVVAAVGLTVVMV